MKLMIEVQMRHLGHALRYHNEQNPSDQIILQDVMNDVVAFETNQPKGRSAAQNHFLCLLALGTALETQDQRPRRWKFGESSRTLRNPVLDPQEF